MPRWNYSPSQVFEVIEHGSAKEYVVACVRFPKEDHPYDKDCGQLIFRCPVCGDVHYHGGGGPFLGDGDGNRVPHCIKNADYPYSFTLREVDDLELAGGFPKRIRQRIMPAPYRPK